MEDTDYYRRQQLISDARRRGERVPETEAPKDRSVREAIESYINSSAEYQKNRYSEEAVEQIKNYISTYLDKLLHTSSEIARGGDVTLSSPEVSPANVEESARRCYEPRILPRYDRYINWGSFIGSGVAGAVFGHWLTILVSETETYGAANFIGDGIFGFIAAVCLFLPRYLHKKSLQTIALR